VFSSDGIGLNRTFFYQEILMLPAIATKSELDVNGRIYPVIEAGVGRLLLYTTTRAEGPVLRSKRLFTECDF
jgi:hypothetical protein